MANHLSASSPAPLRWLRPDVQPSFALLDTRELFERGRHAGRAFFLRTPAGEGWESEELLGLGCAREYAGPGALASAAPALQALRQHTPALPQDLRLLAWTAFDPTYDRTHDTTWADFTPQSLYLPELLVLRRGDHTTILVCAASEPPQQVFQRWLSVLDSPHSAPPPASTPASSSFALADEHRRFTENVAHFVANPDLGKVVFARRDARPGVADARMPAILDGLHQRYPECAIYALSPRHGAPVFVGATPETLVSARDAQLHTMALAGTTRGRSAPDSPERRAAEAALLASPKDRDEHHFVVDMIASALRELGAEPHHGDAPQIKVLANVSHLETPVHAPLTPAFGLLDALDALHPTPAVCGQPRDQARQRIAQREGFDRGLYAGPLGTMNLAGEGRFFVALRCGLLSQSGTLLFAGAGITAESDPQVEWDETGAKLAALGSVLSQEAHP
ncbi:hypothetical protein DL240_05795 [Lujinxingia litoralis]|uniref:isochorismate synthase n=1 Tax=Lujinxingia litoralis TaxID=2211119 RepID=A0A328CCP4_9DELT|nr:isochorismate synthase [Lujinxingia litoralis]RAL23671.1 hypothetical protein DL240_05795 [Lujinxingia litoralis]